MAGKPRTRARNAAAAAARAAADAIPPAMPAPSSSSSAPAPAPSIPDAVPHPFHARAHDARTRASSPRPHRAAPMGPAARAAVDQAQAATLAGIAALLKPGVTLHIERTRPSWCAGWCENYTIEAGESLADLYEHIKSEWGGQRFRILVLGGGNSEMGLEGSIAIDAEPRREGRLISRELEQPAAAPAPRAANPTEGLAAMLPAMAGVLKLFFDQQERVSTAQLTAIRETQLAHRDQTTALVNAALERRERDQQQAQPPSFAQQVEDLAGAFQTMQRAQKLFGSAARGRDRDRDDDPENAGALQEMTKAFMGHAMASFFNKGGQGRAAAPAAAPRRPVGPVRPVTNAQPASPASPRNGLGSIPDAVPQARPAKGDTRN